MIFLSKKGKKILFKPPNINSFFQKLFASPFLIMNAKVYLPLLVAAASVFIVGYWNPKALQKKATSEIAAMPVTDYKWLALIALLSGAMTAAVMDPSVTKALTPK